MLAVKTLFIGVFLAVVTASFSAWAGDPNNGAKIYMKHCINCHGKTGRSLTPGTPDFSMGQSLEKPDPVLAETIKSGKKLMPGYLGLLKEQEILDVISYIRTMR